MIRALVFDLDGVIADTEPIHHRSFHDVLKRWGVSIPQKRWLARYAGTGSKFIFQDVFRRHAVKYDVDKAVAERALIYSQLLGKAKLKPIPGFRRLLALAKRKKLGLAVVSGGHRLHVVKTLEMLGIEKDFVIISIDDVKNRKPHPEGFLRAAGLLRVEPSSCLAFEDGTAGLQASKKAGMTCVALLTSLSRSKLKKADLIVKNFSDRRFWSFLGKLGL